MSDSPANEGPVLPDGDYSAIVLDAVDRAREQGGGTRVDVTITSGEHRGVTLSVTSDQRLGEPTALMAMPATLEVRDGQPRLSIEH